MRFCHTQTRNLKTPNCEISTNTTHKPLHTIQLTNYFTYSSSVSPDKPLRSRPTSCCAGRLKKEKEKPNKTMLVRTKSINIDFLRTTLKLQEANSYTLSAHARPFVPGEQWMKPKRVHWHSQGIKRMREFDINEDKVGEGYALMKRELKGKPESPIKNADPEKALPFTMPPPENCICERVAVMPSNSYYDQVHCGMVPLKPIESTLLASKIYDLLYKGDSDIQTDVKMLYDSTSDEEEWEVLYG